VLIVHSVDVVEPSANNAWHDVTPIAHERLDVRRRNARNARRVRAQIGTGGGTTCTGGTACAFYFTRWDKIQQVLGFTLNPNTVQ
jgi:hypothetical protein